MLGPLLAHPVPCPQHRVKDTCCHEEAWRGLSWGVAGDADSHCPNKLLPKCAGEARPAASCRGSGRGVLIGMNTRAAVNCCGETTQGLRANDLLSQRGRHKTGQRLGKFVEGLLLGAPDGWHFPGRPMRGDEPGPWSP